MFNNLVESGSHRGDLARKGRFMLGTLALYGVLLAASGVASVVAYDARLERQTLELTSIITPVPVETARPPEDEPPRPHGNVAARPDALTERATPIARLRDSTTPPETISAQPNQHKELPDTGRYIITGRDFDPLAGGPPDSPRGEAPGGHPARERAAAPVRVNVAEDPPPPSPTPAPTPKRPETQRLPSSVISSKVISKPAPPYPKIAIATHTQGPVNVEILIDEGGNVISARAVSGPAMLRAAAEQAARQARFTPTLLGGRPVKVSGVITYNFVLN
ncbi:MAG TPA: energy transducer TonB [Pyrinomonadaceae bacterium]|nr:energy transducer TonB [Pyrinomonadaceae bacterium]